ncbi:MAG TPA: DNA-binding response regulator [Gammaproteobacteria bacterium]|nr:DNA-binding response regulator [Gammaproteobacteria bacterium]
MFGDDAREALLILFVLAVVAAASGVDLAADLAHGTDTDHVVKEGLVLALSSLTFGRLLWRLQRQRAEIRGLRRELARAGEGAPAPRRYVLEARKQLGDVVSRQFAEWGLTGSEREVGWLLLKGLSLKEIALVRNTQEKTVRQQASAIYRKSGVAGRHAFSAWFIEDIL